MLASQGKTILLASHDPIIFNSPVSGRIIEVDRFHQREIIRS
jgi:hypothetical protein